jgi:hypothetical protein
MDYQINFPELEHIEIDEIGNVQENNKQLKVFEKDNQTFVKILFNNDLVEIQVGLLALLLKGKSSLKSEHWKDVKVFYVDGDKTNNAIGNLRYRFLRPLESVVFPGFFLIPQFETYAISKTGVLVSLRTCKVLNWSKTKPVEQSNSKGGYKYVNLFQRNGYKNEFMHRILGQVFLDLSKDVTHLVINHKDGDTENNDLENIEWVTVSENVIHSWDTGLCKANSVPVLMKDTTSGVITAFRSASKCAEAWGKTRESIVLNRIRNPGKLYRDKLQFKFDDGTPWPEIQTETIYRNGSYQPVVAHNVFTNDNTVFDSVNECARALDVQAMTVGKMARERKCIPTRGYIFRYLDDDAFEFPRYSKLHLQVFKDRPLNPGNGVFVCEEGREKLFFTSFSEAAKFLGTTTRTLYPYIARNKPYLGKFRLEVFDIEKDLGRL